MNAGIARFLPLGDTGLAIEFADRIDREVSRRVLSLQARLQDMALPGVVEMVPTFRSLLLHLDPDGSDAADLQAAIAPVLDDLEACDAPFRRWSIPVCYEGDMAPDLADVARRTGLAPAQVVEAHSSLEYHVYMIGFLPGYPYMGDVAQAIALPRREDPRLEVPAGSVAIATTQTAIYPVASPGGWHLIGRTPVGLFDARNASPALLRPGDTVTFEPVSGEKYGSIERSRKAGSFSIEPVVSDA